MELKYIIEKTNTYPTIQSFLTNRLNLSTRLITKLIRNKKIQLNNKIADTRTNLKIGDIITIDFNYKEDNSNIIPKKIELDIIFEDEWLLIVNKPAGIAIHPSISHYDDSLSNGIRYYFDKIGLKKKIRPVNRLDLGTSGLVIFAKCEFIQQQLSLQMINHCFKKYYLAWIDGFISEKQGTINLPIARKSDSIIERCVNFETGQKSITHYKVLEESLDKNCSLIECELETGRTHQIRVHFSYLGHPLIGDTLYGKPSNLINSQALQCYKIKFIHPVTKKEMVFSIS